MPSPEKRRAGYGIAAFSPTIDEQIQDSAQSDTDSLTLLERYSSKVPEDLKYAVRVVCHSMWPGDDFQVDNMDLGGRYYAVSIQRVLFRNHVSPATVIESLPRHKELSYVIRMPRSLTTKAAFINDIAASVFASDLSGLIPTAELIAFNLTDDNIIYTPFAVQRRIFGMSVRFAWVGLGLEQRKSLARAIGRIIGELQKVRLNFAGQLAEPPGVHATIEGLSREPARFVPFSSIGQPGVLPEESPDQSIVDFLKAQISHWQTKAVIAQRIDESSEWIKLSKIVDQMSEMGLFHAGMGYRFTHRELRPENIIVSIVDTETVAISGLLGWERSGSLPAFVGCQPPAWLWSGHYACPEQDTELTERFANEAPGTAADEAIKDAFDSTLDDTSWQYAYTGHYRFARTVVRLAVDGLDKPPEGYGPHYHCSVGELAHMWERFMRRQFPQACVPEDYVEEAAPAPEPASPGKDGLKATLAAWREKVMNKNG